ncbi:MAG: hypothetical protein DRP56_09790 [Planctomycetota bacterium]|nr:MAG: hypothetical protein DRP56_09790 [Planctomycetota bacterium]
MKKSVLVLVAMLFVAAIAHATPYSDAVMARMDLVAYYPFEETSGATVDNAEGTSAYDGSINGATLGVARPNDSAGPAFIRGHFWLE